RLLDPNARLGRESVLWRKCDSQLPSLLIPDKTLELTGIQCEPEGGRGEIEPGARSVFGFHRNLIARNRNVPTKTDPSEIRMVSDVSPGIPRVSEKVRPVIAG